jgi:hypothetical protein
MFVWFRHLDQAPFGQVSRLERRVEERAWARLCCRDGCMSAQWSTSSGGSRQDCVAWFLTLPLRVEAGGISVK